MHPKLDDRLTASVRAGDPDTKQVIIRTTSSGIPGLSDTLRGKGHRVVRSGNGLAALDAARREPPHAIVSDIVLPRMDGFALCRKWKQDERLQTIPFLFYTRRHDDPKYERFALELGAERFLARSVPPETLITALEELLACGGWYRVRLPRPERDHQPRRRAGA